MALAAPTRSVYRALVRAGNSTFHGDAAALGNFRGLIRETFCSPTLTSSQLAQQSPAPAPPTSCGGGGGSSSTASTADPSSTFGASQTPAAAAASVESALPGEEVPLRSGSSSEIGQAEYEAKLQHWRDVAEILRRNVVQGQATEEDNAYRLRITKHTELGDNSTIKSPPKLPTTPFPNRNRRNRRRQSEQTTEDGA